MTRKRRRTPIHFPTFGYRDGSVTSCIAYPKPSAKSIKFMGDHIDEDFVYREYYYGFKDVYEFSDQMRARVADVLANRLNNRRSIRELVLPQLEAIQQTLDTIMKRRDQLEQRS